jgi:hypothetical protein
MVHGLQDFFPRLEPNPLGVVEHAGNRGHGNPGFPGDVSNGALALGAHFFVTVYNLALLKKPVKKKLQAFERPGGWEGRYPQDKERKSRDQKLLREGRSIIGKIKIGPSLRSSAWTGHLWDFPSFPLEKDRCREGEAFFKPGKSGKGF